MDDDFNTAQALGAVFETVRAANRFLAENKALDPGAPALLDKVRGLIAEIGGVLGLFGSTPQAWLDGIKSAKADRMDISPEEIERLIAERNDARKARDFKRSDEIRDMLLEKGIQLLDSAQGTTWKIK
jgi:cysteinyl-tRNA synthetase